MIAEEPKTRREPSSGDRGETIGTSLGALAGLAGGIAALINEKDGLFHQHQIDIANNRLDVLDDEISGLKQSEQILARAGQVSTQAYRTLAKHLSALETKESTIERTMPPYHGGQMAEFAAVGGASLIGCLALGAALGNRVGHFIDRFRNRHTPDVTPVEA